MILPHVFKPKPWRAILFSVTILIVVYLALPPGKVFDTNYAIVVYDRNKRLLGARIAFDGQWRFPSLNRIPDKYLQAVVAFEDKRFFYHPGFDPAAMVRALWQNLKARRVVSGGSTLTMQVVRLSRDAGKRTILRKIAEIAGAIRLELHFSKKEIFSMYASHAPFGGNVVGIGAASWRYFGRSPDQLTWAEAALLAVLPNAPSQIHPGKNREELRKKRDRLLAKLHKKGLIGEDDYHLALLEPLPENPHPLPGESLHLTALLNKVNPGQSITTTIDYDLQRNAARVIHQYIGSFKGNGVQNAAVMVIHNPTGEVLVYQGNVTDPAMQCEGWMNDMIRTPRSTGSILKPFLYAAAIDEGLILPATLLPDYPFEAGGFHPQNYGRTFDGAVPARNALQRSLNVPAVRLLQQYGVPKFFELLRNFGMTTLTHEPGHYGLSLILGGAECTLWDITCMYARMSRIVMNYNRFNGMYHPSDLFVPTLVKTSSSVYNPESYRNQLEPGALIGAGALHDVLSILFELNRPEGEAGWREFSSTRGIAWKTGTSYGNRDAWAVGTTPEYTVGVWVGNASGEGRPLLTGAGYAAPLLFDVFHSLPSSSHYELPYKNKEQVVVCRQSGQLAGRFCPETDTLWVAVNGTRTPVCQYHIQVILDESSTYRVNSQCYSLHKMIPTSWFVLPPAMELYYKQKHTDYKPMPDYFPGCEALHAGVPFQLIYPAPGGSVLIPIELSGNKGKVVLQAVHHRSGSVIFWHLDDQYLGSTSSQHHLAVDASPGLKRLVLIDEAGNRLEQKFRIIAGNSSGNNIQFVKN